MSAPDKAEVQQLRVLQARRLVKAFPIVAFEPALARFEAIPDREFLERLEDHGWTPRISEASQ